MYILRQHMATYLQRWRHIHREIRDSANKSDSDAEQTPQADAGHSIQDDNSCSTEEVHVDSADDHAEDLESDISDNFISSESDIDDCIDSDNNEDFGQSLAAWSTSHHISRAALNDLLGLLRTKQLGLPRDARTLLKTPRRIDAADKCGGKYIYLGIQQGIFRTFEENLFTERGGTDIELLFNIDGVPLFKSSTSQFWPILCSFSNCNPFLVALFLGKSKPEPLSDFIGDLLEELVHLRETGICVEDVLYTVRAKGFICDAPARAYLKCIKGHTAYYGCERCTIKGYTKENRRVFFSETPCPLRTDEEFLNFMYKDHQRALSPLTEVGIRCVSSFALDYMHLVCLGVVKRIIVFLKSGPKECKLSNLQLQHISERLESLSGTLPREFARQPRTLCEYERWKATEFRQFLLYTGPLVLHKILPRNTYEVFLTLSVAISLLLQTDDEKRVEYLEYARELLQLFVNSSREVFTDIFTVYNVHSLLHLPDDVEYFGSSFNEISAFPFENYLHSLKRLVRNSNNPIAQVVKRIRELENSTTLKQQRSREMYISSKLKDSCFLTNEEHFAFVKEKRDDGKLVCDVINQRHLENFFETPCESKLLNIAVLKDFRKCKRKLLGRNEIQRKVACLAHEGYYVLFPLLHGAEH